MSKVGNYGLIILTVTRDFFIVPRTPRDSSLGLDKVKQYPIAQTTTN